MNYPQSNLYIYLNCITATYNMHHASHITRRFDTNSSHFELYVKPKASIFSSYRSTYQDKKNHYHDTY